MNWDSTFFGYKTGRLDIENTDEVKDVRFELSRLKSKKYKLIYIFSEDTIPFSASSYFKPFLIDQKVIFFKCVEEPRSTTLPEIRSFCSSEPTEELTELALLSGKYSRYKKDTRFVPGSYERLYTSWLNNSLQRQFADEVFVYEKTDKVRGIITLSYGPTEGIIGLLAVNSESQGMGIGSALISKTCSVLHSKNIKILKVATQLDNVPACKFYKRSGFSVSLITNIYHYWL